MANDILNNPAGSKESAWAVCAGLGERRKRQPWGMEASPWLGLHLRGPGQFSSCCGRFGPASGPGHR